MEVPIFSPDLNPLTSDVISHANEHSTSERAMMGHGRDRHGDHNFSMHSRTWKFLKPPRYTTWAMKERTLAGLEECGEVWRPCELWSLMFIKEERRRYHCVSYVWNVLQYQWPHWEHSEPIQEMLPHTGALGKTTLMLTWSIWIHNSELNLTLMIPSLSLSAAAYLSTYLIPDRALAIGHRSEVAPRMLWRARRIGLAARQDTDTLGKLQYSLSFSQGSYSVDKVDRYGAENGNIVNALWPRQTYLKVNEGQKCLTIL